MGVHSEPVVASLSQVPLPGVQSNVDQSVPAEEAPASSVEPSIAAMGVSPPPSDFFTFFLMKDEKGKF